MNPLLFAFSGLLGLAIGSFLNVVAYRVPLGLSIVRPASACPGCGSPIAARDNVPLASWLLLKGACRHCRMRIPARYPLVEGVTGVAFLLGAVPFLPRALDAQSTSSAAAGALETVAYLYLAAISVVLAVIDIDVHRLPDRIVLPAYAVGAALLGAAGLLRGDLVALGTAASGAGAAFLLYLVLALAKPGGMGLGDVKLAGVLGLFLGYSGIEQLAVGIAAAFVLGGVFGVALLVTRRSTRSSGIPFGPWMLGGAWIGVLAGVPVAHAYLTLVGLT
jgi:leader peptidase (prepilin peptidase)/N-methyltransferase